MRNETDMKRIIFAILLIAASYSEVFYAAGADPVSKPVENNNTYALIICGINKEPQERLAKGKAVKDLRGFFLSKAKLKPDRLKVLVADNSLFGKDTKKSSAENLKQTIKEFSDTVRPGDRFVLYYIGQANMAEDNLRFNLPGKDITHEQLAEWVRQIKASSILLVLDCPGAGRAVKALTGKGRIVIGASTAEQNYSTKFSEYFIPSLLDGRSDTDSDGRISLLEAFTFASKQIDDWYFERLFLKTETPILEDNADGFPSSQPWKYKEGNTDGRQASRFFLMEKE